MAAATRSALHVRGWLTELFLLVGTSIAAAFAHVAAAGLIFALSLLPFCNVPPPVPDDVIQVSLVSMPRSDSAMAQMDVAVATKAAPVDADAPAPEKDPGLVEQGTAEPPPETASDLAFETPDAKEAKGDPNRTRVDAREEALNRLKREQMLAALGSAESTAGDPDSSSSERINLGGVGLSDPELARYVQRVKQIFLENFNPLPTIAQNNPDIAATINVRVNLDTGRIESWSWKQRSGNPSWDGACERAVEAVTSLPPPPEKFRSFFAQGYDMRCVPN